MIFWNIESEHMSVFVIVLATDKKKHMGFLELHFRGLRANTLAGLLQVLVLDKGIHMGFLRPVGYVGATTSML